MKIGHLHRCLLALSVTLLALAPGATGAAPPVAGTWTLTGTLHQARGFQTATLLPNGLVLVAGGFGTNGTLTSAELYHPHTGSWAVTGAMHQPRGQFTATLLRDGQVLVAGGFGANGSDSKPSASAELYNPRTGVWTMTGSMHARRAFSTATLMPDGRVLVTGGVAGSCPNSLCSDVLASAELYDPHTGTWTLTSPMHLARARQTATLLPNGQVLVAGGSAGGANFADSGSLTSAELYHPRTGTWMATGSMSNARWSATADLLPSGVVLVAGGFSDSGAVLQAEIYHPSTGRWTLTGSLHQPRAYETAEAAALLPGGQVLVAGSVEGPAGTVTGNTSAGAEVFHPRTGTWTTTGSMHAPRIALTATLLPTGQVLVVGGCTDNGCTRILDSAELYHP